MIAGPDWEGYGENLRRKVAEEKIANVEFTGPADAEMKDQLYREADVFVLPSPMENFSMVVLEALAYGVPAIATKGTPWAELEGVGEVGVESRRRRAVAEAGLFNAEEQRSRGAGDDSYRRNCDRLLLPSGCAADGAKAKQSDAIPRLPQASAGENRGRCGWWIDQGVEPLKAALAEAMALSDEERAEMGARGRELARRKYSWESVAEKILCAMTEVGINEKPTQKH